MTTRVLSRKSPILRTGVAAAAALACAALLAGCSSGPGIGRPLTAEQRAKNAPANYEGYAKLGYRLDWSGFPTVTGNLPVIFLDAGPDYVVAQEAGTYITVLSTGTGAQVARAQLTAPLTRFVGMKRFEGRIYSASESELYILDIATCNLLERQRFEEIVSTAPALGAGNLLIFGTGNDRLIAHMLDAGIDGVKLWGFAVDGHFEHKPVRVGSAVGAVSQRGEVVFLEPRSGALLGRNRVFGGMAVDPVADDNTMYVANLDQSIYAFAAEGGAMRWRFRTDHPLRTQPTLHGGTLYCYLEGQGLTAIDASNGSQLWAAKGVKGTVVAVNKGRLIVWDGQTASVVDPKRGDLIDQVPLPGAVTLRPDSFENGNLYIISKTAVVYRLVPR